MNPCIYVSMHLCIYVSVCLCICLHIGVYIYICICTYTMHTIQDAHFRARFAKPKFKTRISRIHPVQSKRSSHPCSIKFGAPRTSWSCTSPHAHSIRFGAPRQSWDCTSPSRARPYRETLDIDKSSCCVGGLRRLT